MRSFSPRWRAPEGAPGRSGCGRPLHFAAQAKLFQSFAIAQNATGRKIERCKNIYPKTFGFWRKKVALGDKLLTGFYKPVSNEKFLRNFSKSC